MADDLGAFDDEDEDEWRRPSAERVARRALVLAAMTYRAHLESRPPAEAAPLRSRLIAWLGEVDLWGEVEAVEESVLRARLGALERQDVVNATWRTEGLVVLAWALGAMEMPAHDEQGSAQPIAEAFGLLHPEPMVLRAPLLRSPDDLDTYGERAFAVHWRARQFGIDLAPMDFAAFAETAWFGPLEIEGLAFAEGDLAIRGVPFARSPHWREIGSIAVERHQAANWLRGHAELYSEVGTDT